MDEMTNIDTGDASTAALQKYIKNICQGHDMDYTFNQIDLFRQIESRLVDLHQGKCYFWIGDEFLEKSKWMPPKSKTVKTSVLI